MSYLIKRKSVLVCLTMWGLALPIFGCTTTKDLHPYNINITPGTSRIYKSPKEIVFQKAQEASQELGLKIVEISSDNSHFVAERGMTGFSLGEIVGIYLTEEGQSTTAVNIVSKRKVATNIGAKDFAPDLHAAISRKLQHLEVFSQPSSAKEKAILEKSKHSRSEAPLPSPRATDQKAIVNEKNNKASFITSFYTNSYALVIGIDMYPASAWKKLSYAVKDAYGIAEYLARQGFQVISLYNQQATKEAIIYQMQNVLARRVGRNDRILVFFAGHGYTERLGDKDYGYIVPYDGKSDSSSYLSMEELHALSRKMDNAKHQLFIMDACYGGLLGLRSGALDANRPYYLEEITRRKARQILTAGGANQQVVDGGPGRHSLFTGQLLKALQEGLGDLNGDGYITFSELASYLIRAAANTYQTPGSGTLPGHELGEFLFRAP
jgi:hypothetical protein